LKVSTYMVGNRNCVHGGQSKVNYFANCFCYWNVWDVKILHIYCI